MAYIKQNFIDGNTLYADELNHIEDGIEDTNNELNNLNDTVQNDYALKTLENVNLGTVTQEYNIIIPIGNWEEDLEEGYAFQNVVVPDVQSDDRIIIDIDLSNITTWEEKVSKVQDWGNIIQASVSDGMITLYSYAIPLSDLTIKLMAIRK